MRLYPALFVIYGIALVLFLLFACTPLVVAEPLPDEFRSPAYHRTQAAQYRAEVTRLQGAIHRYEILVRVYSMGSDRATGTFNPQGRRLMVERTKRTIVYFTQQKSANEQRAAEHETLAQMLPAP